jgi:hypothetical protein
MDKKEALLRSLIELRTAHDKASAALAIIVNVGARAVKGQDSVPAVSDIRNYKKAIASAKVHAVQAELVLLEYALPKMNIDNMEYAMHMQ